MATKRHAMTTDAQDAGSRFVAWAITTMRHAAEGARKCEVCKGRGYVPSALVHAAECPGCGGSGMERDRHT